MGNGFTALGNFQRGYYDRILGRGGSLSTAKRINRMLLKLAEERNANGVYNPPSIVDTRFAVALWTFIEKKGKVTDKQKNELVKRLLQQLEMEIFSSLDDQTSKTLVDEFEENL